MILRTSRFFPEPDDDPEIRGDYEDANIKVNELLYRRVDVEDAAVAHCLALEVAPSIEFGTFIVSATTPFTPEDLAELRTDAALVVRHKFPQCEEIFAQRGWKLFPVIDRVYVNGRARQTLGWSPRYDFEYALSQLAVGREPQSPLALEIGAKGYHAHSAYPYTKR